MISRIKQINAFTQLGSFIEDPQNQAILSDWCQAAYLKNNWFKPELVQQSLLALAEQYLRKNKLEAWLEKYPLPNSPCKVGVVMAGNIPAVGFHDVLCVLASGHTLLAKPSTDDQALMLLLLQKLISFEPSLAEQIQIVDRLNEADAYIATGSDNTARYFHYYFAKKPHIIRKNRTSIAILTGEETHEELKALGEDVLKYYGLGCRNVSKIYVPKDYEFTPFYEAIEPMADRFLNHHKYFNNYEYNKSIVLINRVPHFDNGFLILTESPALVSPISMLHYQRYERLTDIEESLVDQQEKIQCVISSSQLNWPHSIEMGKSQSPGLSDYADNVDTMKFLSSLG
ncbi:acyl-CoA reductase LuxC [Dyadobacter jejuensis]|uniref:Acyl-CoA reductase LuxC n=1 Tax=Dyadobacter jejuensis TaxID=1082580 RepID=A0A316AN41_9BACT|nr:acyl-CoA reductase [Dyadobacter jejuensis]PWJ58878.1 acyl-CoA reductase LuxC [Dyadobacter jejuensis]